MHSVEGLKAPQGKTKGYFRAEFCRNAPKCSCRQKFQSVCLEAVT